MEGTDAHPVSSHPDSEMLGSLPGGNRLLDSFKYIQIDPPKIRKAPVILEKENGKRLLKFHILFFLLGCFLHLFLFLLFLLILQAFFERMLRLWLFLSRLFRR